MGLLGEVNALMPTGSGTQQLGHSAVASHVASASHLSLPPFPGFQDLTRFHVDQWVDWSNSLEDVYANWIYFLWGAKQLPADQRDAAIAESQAKFERALGALNKHMEGRKWLVGDSITLAVSGWGQCTWVGRGMCAGPALQGQLVQVLQTGARFSVCGWKHWCKSMAMHSALAVVAM